MKGKDCLKNSLTLQVPSQCSKAFTLADTHHNLGNSLIPQGGSVEDKIPEMLINIQEENKLRERRRKGKGGGGGPEGKEVSK